MRILFVSAVLPWPLYSGGQVRIYNLLKRLSVRHDITLYAFIRDETEKRHIKELAFCKKVVTVLRGRVWQPKYLLKAMTGSYPLLWSSYDNREMFALLSGEIGRNNYDLVHIEPGYVFPALPPIDIPLVVSEHNIEHAVYAAYVNTLPKLVRSFFSRDVEKIKRWEEKVWKRASHVTAVYGGDHKHIASIIDSKRVSVVGNGVDLTHFLFLPKKNLSPKGLTFLYVGNFLWIENIDAAEYLLKNIWPPILQRYPGARLRIVGKHVPVRLRLLGASPSVSFFGHVEEIYREYQSADILLAPIRVGGGTKYKLIEAMASGLPVITTSIGAEGVEDKGSRGLLIADSPQETLQSVKMLLDNTKRIFLVTNARSMIEKSFSWDVIAKQLEKVWKQTYEHGN